MKTVSLLDNLKFSEDRPQADPLLVDETGRVLRFSLKPGQSVKEHRAPHSPVHLVVLRGRGMFSGEDGREQPLGPGTLIAIKANEPHAIRALDEALVFVALLHQAPEAKRREQADPA
jgi:quercetin dioxygenase-like cupin family protein